MSCYYSYLIFQRSAEVELHVLRPHSAASPRLVAKDGPEQFFGVDGRMKVPATAGEVAERIGSSGPTAAAAKRVVLLFG